MHFYMKFTMNLCAKYVVSLISFLCTICIDGVQVLWWDTRSLHEPVEIFCLDAEKKQDCTRTTGAVYLEYEPTMVLQCSFLFEQCMILIIM